MTYEEAAKELETIISKLETGNLAMGEAMKLFERGEELSKICFKELNTAKGKLTLIKEELSRLTETSAIDE